MRTSHKTPSRAGSSQPTAQAPAGHMRIRNFDGNNQELQRSLYVLEFLLTGSRESAKLASGLTGNCHDRIIEMYRDRGHHFDAFRSGRPTSYTLEMMQEALHFLINYEEGYLAGTDLWQKLVDRGTLHDTSCVDRFMYHFRAYVESKGMKLITNSTKTVFLLTHQDVKERLRYAQQLLPIMNPRQLDMVIFVDETTLEESPHPKGDMLNGMLLACSLLCVIRVLHTHVVMYIQACHYRVLDASNGACSCVRACACMCVHGCTLTPIHVMLYFTGQRHVAAHLHVPHQMKTPQRTYTDASVRRNLKLAVAICKSGGVFIKELTGTQYKGCKSIRTYKSAPGKTLSCMGAEEYKEFLKDAWQHFLNQPSFWQRRDEAILIHDRYRVHDSKLVKAYLAEKKIKVFVQPARSPDLMPLDYGIFGTAKAALGGRVQRCRTWEERVSRLEGTLRAAARDKLIRNTIDQFPRRLEACIRADGGHIERRML
jgi:hypothetical protein